MLLLIVSRIYSGTRQPPQPSPGSQHRGLLGKIRVCVAHLSLNVGPVGRPSTPTPCLTPPLLDVPKTPHLPKTGQNVEVPVCFSHPRPHLTPPPHRSSTAALRTLGFSSSVLRLTSGKMADSKKGGGAAGDSDARC